MRYDPLLILFRVIASCFTVAVGRFFWLNFHWFSRSGIIIYSTVMSVVIFVFSLSFLQRSWSYWVIAAFCVLFPLVLLLAMMRLSLHGGSIFENVLGSAALEGV
jgi:hypothetical protein